MTEYIYLIFIHDADVLIPIGYERNEATAKRRVRQYLGLSENDKQDIYIFDSGREIRDDGVLICKVPFHGIEEYLHEAKYVSKE